MPEPQQMRAVVGDRVRTVREREGLRQQDLSDAARRLGLNTWTRTRIAALERGDKALSAEDLVRVLAVLRFAAGRVVDLSELLDVDVEIALTDHVVIPARAVVDVLRGGDPAELAVVLHDPAALSEWDAPALRGEAALARRILRAAGRNGLPNVGETRGVELGLREADERAARDLGLPSYPFRTLCLVLWGRSLSAERDGRLADRAEENATAGSIAAMRGRITRDLLAEARVFLAAMGEVARGEHQEAP